MEPDEDALDAGPDVVWKWTIRALYTAAIALNLWLMVQAARDDPEAQIAIGQLKHKATEWARPLTRRRWLKREANRVVWEAMTVVEGAGT